VLTRQPLPEPSCRNRLTKPSFANPQKETADATPQLSRPYTRHTAVRLGGRARSGITKDTR